MVIRELQIYYNYDTRFYLNVCNNIQSRSMAFKSIPGLSSCVLDSDMKVFQPVHWVCVGCGPITIWYGVNWVLL